MGLLRLLILFAICWFVWRLLMRAVVSSSPAAPPPRAGEQAQDHDYLPLTKCAICGAHIPQPSNNAAPICERCRSR
jgi:hypothetical protein